ncbi:hypothetical protein EXIGLDRAFT_753707 [Exidia glandulosa HHB12029]|uniref:Fungal-type protein kinase domain-containing protein n=1 Tax=Exidia glandulosa HHB12029 TaxID=1314781 RepID=A0A165DJ73_EXIGL|nr:hypothetical protein EXIGLDRAFT_753707 [Exidia glandulosa HHB12029]
MDTIPADVDAEYVQNAKHLYEHITSVKAAQKSLWEAIGDEPGVKAALATLLNTIATSDTEGPRYAPAVRLCNLISQAYVLHSGHVVESQENASDVGDIVVFTNPWTQPTKGDYLGIDTKADVISFVADYAKLRTALMGVAYCAAMYWQHGLSVGDLKTANEKSKGQVKGYAVALKRYRPDLTEVHAFQAEKDWLYLFTLSPAGMWSSGALPVHELDGWIAYVLLAYRSHALRDETIRCVDMERFVRWDLELGNRTLVLAPFEAGDVPGRNSWVAMEVDVPTSITVHDEDRVRKAFLELPPAGVVKVSWQDTRRLVREGQLLEEAHADGWIPGLVRPGDYHPGPIPAAQATAASASASNLPLIGSGVLITAPVGSNIERQKTVLELRSIGQPLSRCTDPLHFIKVIYDAIETHLHLWEKGILHRDISWGNVLCNPIHRTDGVDPRQVLDRPCIARILGEDLKDPYVLLTDLDHAGRWKDLISESYKPRIHRTGTPLFVSSELSSPIPIPLPARAAGIMGLRDAFKSLEGDAFFREAFPDAEANNAFLSSLDIVVQSEIDRNYLVMFAAEDSPAHATTNPQLRHLPRHDVESFYWILLWGLTRGNPLDEVDGDEATKKLSIFAWKMIRHTIGEDDSDLRQPYMEHLRQKKTAGILHVRLQFYATMLHNIAIYLSVPWHLYEPYPENRHAGRVPTLPLEHAHHAVRRIILMMFLENDKPVPKFNVERPRFLLPEAETGKHTPGNTPATGGATAKRSNPPRSEGRQAAKRTKQLFERESRDEDQEEERRLDEEALVEDPSFKLPGEYKKFRGTALPGSAAQRFDWNWNDRRWFGSGH